MQRETIALHAGYAPEAGTKAVAVPIYQTVAYAFDSAEHGAALFDLEAEGFRYSRISNPTTSVLEKRVAALEGGVASLCVASGQAALHYALLNLVEMGSNIVSVPQLYGTTHTLFTHLMRDYGVTVRFAETDQAEAIDRLIDQDTKAVFCESVGNPAGNICDVQSLAEVAHAHGVPLVVDNTVATPILLRPFEFGADIVVHSLTKFLGGHGTTLGGAIVDSGNFPWAKHPDRFPRFNQPEPSYHGLIYAERFGRMAYIERCRSYHQRISGSVLSPLSAFLLLQGIETVALRVERHVANAKVVAEFLRGHPNVDWVNYAGFPDNPYYKLAQKYLGGHACSLMTFGVRGGFDAGVRVLQRVGSDQSVGQSRGCQDIGVSSGLDHPSPDARCGTSEGRCDAGDDSSQRGYRTRRRHHCRLGSGPAMLTIGILNSMPEAAVRSTERQFGELLTEAAGSDIPLRLKWFSLQPRDGYGSSHDLWATHHLDGLIATGTEPRAAYLNEEPYWDAFTRTVEWATTHTTSADLVMPRGARRRAVSRWRSAPPVREEVPRRLWHYQARAASVAGRYRAVLGRAPFALE